MNHRGSLFLSQLTAGIISHCDRIFTFAGVHFERRFGSFNDSPIDFHTRDPHMKKRKKYGHL